MSAGPQSTLRRPPRHPGYSQTSHHRGGRRRRGGGAAGLRRVIAALAGIASVVLVVALLIPQIDSAVRDITLPLSHQDIIRQQAAEKHLDPALIAAVIFAETKFDPRTSAAGAEGLMQILPDTAAFIAHRSGGTRFTTSDLAAPQTNVAYGSYYLRYLLNHYGGNEMLAVAAYNGGLANVDRWLAAARSSGTDLTIDTIPFPETRAYVARVLQAQRDYRATYPHELGLS